MPRPITDITRAQARAIHTLVTDVDDTLTTDGALTAAAYAALERLKQDGIRIVVTTGRPCGWCDHIARMWPVDAVVGENGAVYYWYDRAARKLKARHSLPAAERRANSERIRAVGEEVLRRVPGTALASDQFCRLYDLAIDYREDVAPLADSAVMESVRIMEDAGMTAKVSSIHVNAWFGDYDKLTMTRAAMKELFGIDLDADNRGFVYTGDSPNDAPMFAHFRNSVGVANVMDFAGRIASMPNYITSRRSGDGFAELAAHLTGMRASAAAHSTGTADAPA